MDVIRRAYVYGVALVSLCLFAASVDGVLAWLGHVAMARPDASGSDEAPLLSIAGLIVQAPIWATHWILAQAGARRPGSDRRSAIRRAYLLLAMAGAVAGAASGLATLVRVAVDGPDVDAIDALAALATAVPVLFLHRAALVDDLAIVPESRATAALRRLYLAGAATIAGLVALAAGAGLATTLLERAAGLGPHVGGQDVRVVAEMTGALVAGALAWGTHHRGAILPGPPAGPEAVAFLPALHRLVVLTVAVGATLANVAWTLDFSLGHLMGHEVRTSDLPTAIATIATYGVAWWAWRRSLAPAPDGEASARAARWVATLDRTHRALVVVVALGVAGAGVVRVIADLMDAALGVRAMTGLPDHGLRTWVAIVVTGLPAWLAFWRPPGHPRLSDEEVASRPRRAGLYLVAFACAVAVLTSGVWVAYGALGMVLGRPFDFPSLAIAATVVAGAIGAYHLHVLRLEVRHLATLAPLIEAGPDEGGDAPGAATPWAAIWAAPDGVRVAWFATREAATARLAGTGAPRWQAVALADPPMPETPLTDPPVTDPGDAS